MVTSATSRFAEWRQTPARLVGVVALALAAAVFLWQLPHFLAGNSTVWPQYASAFTDMLTYTAWGAAVLLVLTALTRTVSLRLLLAFWFLGVFAVHGLVIALELVFRDSMGVTDMGIWVAPVVETLVVLLVIVAFYALATYRRATQPTVSDGLLIGFATGAGLGFHEEMTYARLVPIGPGAEYGSVGRMGQDIWWSYVFPLIGWQGQFNIRQFGNGVAGHFTLYHAGWATLLGIGVGLVFVHRHHVLAWLAGALAVAVTYFEHMSGNFSVGRPLETPLLIGDLFQAGDVTGVSEVAVYLLLVAISGALLTDIFVIRRIASQINIFPSVSSKLLSDTDGLISWSATIPGGFGVARWLRDLGEYARFRRALMVGIYRVQETSGDPATLQSALTVLYEKGRRADIIVGVGLCVAAFLAGLGILSSSGLTLSAGSASLQTVSCAGCASPSRFMATAPYVIGAVFAAVAVFTELRTPVPDPPSKTALKEPDFNPNLEEVKEYANLVDKDNGAKEVPLSEINYVYINNGEIKGRNSSTNDFITLDRLVYENGVLTAYVGDERVPIPDATVETWDATTSEFTRIDATHIRSTLLSNEEIEQRAGSLFIGPIGPSVSIDGGGSINLDHVAYVDGSLTGYRNGQPVDLSGVRGATAWNPYSREIVDLMVPKPSSSSESHDVKAMKAAIRRDNSIDWDRPFEQQDIDDTSWTLNHSAVGKHGTQGASEKAKDHIWSTAVGILTGGLSKLASGLGFLKTASALKGYQTVSDVKSSTDMVDNATDVDEARKRGE